MKIRPDSLYGRMEKRGDIDDFFRWYAAENPDYKAMLKWFRQHKYRTSTGAVNNLVTNYYGIWKAEQAMQAADEAVKQLPPDADEKLVSLVHGMKFDLVVRDLSATDQIKVWSLDQKERELELKRLNIRDAGVQALMAEAEGNERAKTALAEFLKALEKAKAE